MMHRNPRWTIDASAHRWPTLQRDPEMINLLITTVHRPESRDQATNIIITTDIIYSAIVLAMIIHQLLLFYMKVFMQPHV